MFFAPSKPRKRANIWNMSVSKTSAHIQIKIKMQNPSQEPPAPTKAPHQYLKEMDVLCIFKMMIEKTNWNMGIPKTSDHIQIMINMLSPSQKLQPPPKPKIRT